MTVDITQIAEQFWLDGYVELPEYFEAPLMSCLNALILSHFGDNPAFQHEEEFLDRAKTEVIPWFPQNEGVGEFDHIEKMHCLQQLSSVILGEGWVSDYSMVMFSRQGTSGQAWHQDCPPDNPSVFNLNRLVYTSDITDEIGGQTVVVPGSHRHGEISVGNPTGEFAEQRILRPRAGTLVLLHGHTWHRVLPIVGGHRFSTNYRAKSPAAPDHVTDICVYRNMRYQFSTSSIIQERF